MRAGAAITVATMCPAFSNKGNSYAQLMATQSQPRLDACVLRAGAVQIMRDPGRSTALGKSSMRREPSLGGPSRCGLTPRSAERRYELYAELSGATRASVTNPSERAWIPHRDTEGAALRTRTVHQRQPDIDSQSSNGCGSLGAARRGAAPAARGAGRTPKRAGSNAAEIR